MDTYDLFSPTFKTDPFPTYAAMREDTPIYKHTSPNGGVVWYITRYAEATAVFNNSHDFCKNPRNKEALEIFPILGNRCVYSSKLPPLFI